MKNIASIILVVTLQLIAVNSNAQKADKKEQIVIKTSAVCEQCKERLEKAMAYEKGVVSSNLDVTTSKFTVVYKVDKTTPDKIRLAISKVGYDADSIKADQKAYENLPQCCQKGGH